MPLLSDECVFAELCTEALVPYDTARYPFAPLVHRMLALPADVPLSRVHDALEGGASSVPLLTLATDQSTVLHKRFYGSELFLGELVPLYRRLVCEHLATQPHWADEQVIVYQARPTFRVHLPGNVAVGEKHRDSDYHHPTAEINYWLPVTRVWDTNGFYTETAPDRGDFHPIALDYGQMLRFYGSRCWHYNRINDTGSARVSMDFRLIAGSRWTGSLDPADAARAASDGAAAGASVKSNMRFMVGSYYAVYDRRAPAH